MSKQSRKPGEAKFEPGGFFDSRSYLGSIRFFLFAVIVIYVSRDIDNFLAWLWNLFGKKVYVSPDKAIFHAKVVAAMMLLPIFLALCNFHATYKLKRYLKQARGKSDEEVAQRLKELERSRQYIIRSDDVVDGPKAFFLEETIKKWPVLHDLIWGWPFLMAMLLPFIVRRVDAVFGLLLGGVAYSFNHAISKLKFPSAVKLVLSFAIGLVALSTWLCFSSVTGLYFLI